VVFLDPGLNGILGLSNIGLTTLVGDPVNAQCFQAKFLPLVAVQYTTSPFTDHHPYPFPIGQVWTFYRHFDNTCSGWSDTPTCTPLTANIIILSRFLLAAKLPQPTSYWLPDSIPFVLQAYVRARFPRAIHFTLNMEAARSSETLVSCRNTTRYLNPDLDFNLHRRENPVSRISIVCVFT
jgi:hypothetical protein